MPSASADFRTYLDKARDDLIASLALVASELANAHIMLASSLTQEKSARVQGFMRSQETSVAGRERDAEAQAMASYTSVVELKAQIAALCEERDLLRLLIEVHSARTDRPVDHTEGLQSGDQGPGSTGEHQPQA